MSEPSLLLLIPAYNEESRIEPVLREYGRYFQQGYHGKFQLVVVLNGCKDNTLGVVQKVAAEYPFISFLDFPEAIGKGGALIEGLKLAPLSDLIGSRWLPESVLHVEQTDRRRFASRVFHFIVELFFRMHIKDTQCGAKVMRRQAVEKIHSALRIADMAFDINLLYSLKREGFRILEVPTEWTDKLGSKVTLFRTSLTMFLSVVRIWLIYSPRIYKLLRPLRPLETWIYKKLRQPQPRPGPDREPPKDDDQNPKPD